MEQLRKIAFDAWEDFDDVTVVFPGDKKEVDNWLDQLQNEWNDNPDHWEYSAYVERIAPDTYVFRSYVNPDPEEDEDFDVDKF